MLGEFKLIIDTVSTACTINHSSIPVYCVFDFYCRSSSSEPHIVRVVCVCVGMDPRPESKITAVACRLCRDVS